MKNIIKRKDGRYMIRLTINGKRVSQYAKTINEAKKLRAKLNKNHSSILLEPKCTKLSEWIFEWEEKYKKPFVKNKTFNEIVNNMKKVDNYFKNISLKQITTSMLQTFMNSLKKNRTKERIQVYLNSLLQKAEDLNLINKNPYKGVIREPKLKLKRECFNFAEQTKILETIKGTTIENEIYIYLLTGCRPNELPENSNFDFENKFVIINGTKTEKSLKRFVEMSDAFIAYIKPYIEANKRIKVTEISKTFKNLCKEANIQNPSLYRLRHTFATNHFTLGTQPKVVQYWMGHASIKMTMDVYTDIDRTANAEKIRNLYKNFYFEKD